MKPNVRLSAILALGLAAFPLADRAWAASYHVRRGDVVVVCPLTVGGSFEARTSVVSGRLSHAQGGAVEGAVEVDARTLDTGIELRNSHLRENYLEVGKGQGYEKVSLSDLQVEVADLAAHQGKAAFKGTIEIHGQRRPVAGTAEIRRSGDVVSVEATFPVLVSEFQIPKPSYMGVGVKNEVKVKVSLDLAPLGGGEK